MTDSIACPIILAEGTDVSTFRSVKEAEEYLEKLGASNRKLAVFDAEGRGLALQRSDPEEEPAPGTPAKVRLQLEGGGPDRKEELGRILKDYLEACGEHTRPDATLQDLVLRCAVLHLYRE